MDVHRVGMTITDPATPGSHQSVIWSMMSPSTQSWTPSPLAEVHLGVTGIGEAKDGAATVGRSFGQVHP